MHRTHRWALRSVREFIDGDDGSQAVSCDAVVFVRLQQTVCLVFRFVLLRCLSGCLISDVLFQCSGPWWRFCYLVGEELNDADRYHREHAASFMRHDVSIFDGTSGAVSCI